MQCALRGCSSALPRGAFKQALNVGGKLSDLSANTGVAVGDLVVLQQEFANAGKSAEDLGPVLGKMAKSLQGGGADDTIKKLGINLDELKKKSPAEQFRALGSAINAVQERARPHPPFAGGARHRAKEPTANRAVTIP